jgi:hypothetical protein
MSIAVLQTNYRWLIYELSMVEQPSSLFLRLKSRLLTPGCILSGFDFPIGFPLSYAAKALITDFLITLPFLGQNESNHFYIPAELPSEINIHRPFYPQKPGNSKRSYLELGLDLTFDKLYRLCEVGRVNRLPACPLFWTLGGQQVGKAAISGWRDLISPALFDHQLYLKIWPFSGPLAHVCQSENIVAVETYPAEFYAHLGLSFSSPGRRSKRRQLDRMAFAEQLIFWAKEYLVDLDHSILNSIMIGFGNGLDGEERFDALVGLYGMIIVILGNQPVWELNLPQISGIEGWIFGQERPKE